MLSPKTQIDLFIIQIRMKKIGGHRLAEKIRGIKRYRQTPVIFVATHSNDNIGGFGVATYSSLGHHNYISTPICRLDVQGKLGLYIDELLSRDKSDADTQKVVYLEYNKGAAFIKLSDIFFAEIQDKAATIHTSGGIYKTGRTSLDKIIDSIDDEYFIRTHKSFAANAGAISKVERDGRRNRRLIFADGTYCPLSQTYYRNFLSLYSSVKSDMAR